MRFVALGTRLRYEDRATATVESFGLTGASNDANWFPHGWVASRGLPRIQHEQRPYPVVVT